MMSAPTIRLVAGNAHPALGNRIAQELGIEPVKTEVGAFADGEMKVRIAGDVRGTAVVIVQPTCPPVDEHLMTLALLADAARAAGAERVIAVVPYFGYARQDRRDRPGDPRSAQVAGKLLGAVGIDHLITLDLHSPALESALPMPATLLGAETAFLPRLAQRKFKDLVVVSPDAGGLKRAQHYAAALKAGLAVVAKERPRPDVTATVQVLGDVRGRDCLIVDDLASTGRTLAGAAESLRKSGAREVHAAFTHAVMGPDASERLRSAGFSTLLATDSTPVSPPSSPWPGLEIVPVAPILAQAVRDACGSATSERAEPPSDTRPPLSGLEFRTLEELSHEPQRADAISGSRGGRPAVSGEIEGT
jgi:ribose-phosphate pyrophosphokinase